MTQERFLNILGDPDLLATISYQELKTLTLAYPYAHNLRYLLALKAQQDNHPEFSNALASASAYSLHRPQLFQLIAPQRVSVLESVLELKAIEAVQRELEARQPLSRQEETTESSAAVRTEKRPPDPAIETSQPESRTPEYTQTEEQNEISVPPLPRFDQWLDQFQLPPLSPRPMRPAVTKAPKPAPAEPAEKSRPAQTLAERSVTQKEEVVSETMARLFAAQGHRDKAIALYERLRLAFPEKSDYFAAEIDKLKQ